MEKNNIYEVLRKPSRVHLTGTKLRKLNERIHDRDEDSCIICGRWVERGVKFHHEPPGIHKEDKEEKGVLLCYECHQERHHGKNSEYIRQKAVEYLAEMYS